MTLPITSHPQLVRRVRHSWIPACVDLKVGDVIQLERRGFFRVDVPYGGSTDKPLVLFMIP